jgi:hypothetical protein
MAQADHWLPGFNFNVEEWDCAGKSRSADCFCIIGCPERRRIRTRQIAAAAQQGAAPMPRAGDCAESAFADD